MELIDNLTKELGINEEQAKGASGLIFKMVKHQLGDDDFGKVAEAVPEVNEILESAPETGGISGTIGGLTSHLGGKLGKLGDIASVSGGFSKLGLDKEMIGKFTPAILSFVQSKGGDTVKGLIEKVLH